MMFFSQTSAQRIENYCVPAFGNFYKCEIKNAKVNSRLLKGVIPMFRVLFYVQKPRLGE